ncbi:MAG: BamA/TamA family outer membrane protein [Kofleriaceae bacterium]
MTLLQRLLLGASLIAATAATAHTESDEPTAADVASAPPPNTIEDGRLDDEPGDSTARVIARGALFVPRMVFVTVTKPFEGGAWLFERFQLGERYYRVFWNDERTAGVFPTIGLQSGFGIDIGARFVHRDLAGHGEKLSLSTSTGGQYRTLTKASLRSGRRFDPVELSVDARFEQKPKDTYYGVGNELGEETRYRDRYTRATGSADIRLGGPFHLTASGAYADHAYSTSEHGTPVEQMYGTELTGWQGTRYGYGELELRYDTRRASTAYEAPVFTSRGTLVAAYTGAAIALDDNSADYRRYGADLQQFFRLAEGPRVLSLRAHVEGVTGNLDEVPFTDLPRLGGKQSLRGYSLDRFRDRIAAVGSAEYTWDLARILSASLFVDVGRVYRSLDDLTLDDVRVGYGVGLDVHTEHSFVGRVSLASSIDGGVFVDFSVDPIFDLERRVDRR